MRRALWLGGLLITLAGLFGMHGLAEHGTERMGSAHAAMSMPATGASSTGGHLTRDMVATVSSALVATVSRAPGGGTGMDMSAVGMCLAVLLLTAMSLIVHLHANRLRPVLFLTARPARAPVTPSREADPPNLFALSIQRC